MDGGGSSNSSPTRSAPEASQVFKELKEFHLPVLLSGPDRMQLFFLFPFFPVYVSLSLLRSFCPSIVSHPFLLFTFVRRPLVCLTTYY